MKLSKTQIAFNSLLNAIQQALANADSSILPTTRHSEALMAASLRALSAAVQSKYLKPEREPYPRLQQVPHQSGWYAPKTPIPFQKPKASAIPQYPKAPLFSLVSICKGT